MNYMDWIRWSKSATEFDLGSIFIENALGVHLNYFNAHQSMHDGGFLL